MLNKKTVTGTKPDRVPPKRPGYPGRLPLALALAITIVALPVADTHSTCRGPTILATSCSSWRVLLVWNGAALINLKGDPGPITLVAGNSGSESANHSLSSLRDYGTASSPLLHEVVVDHNTHGLALQVFWVHSGILWKRTSSSIQFNIDVICNTQTGQTCFSIVYPQMPS